MTSPSGALAAGAEPFAAVVGGIVALACSGIVLVLCRNGLRKGSTLRPVAWAGLGAAGGVVLYAIGLCVIGRGRDLAPAALFAGVPWVLALVAATGALIAYVMGARGGWHPAGVAVFESLALASTGWGAYLAGARVPRFFADPTLANAALFGVLFAQLLSLALVCAVAAYMLDALVRRRWARRASSARHDPSLRPKVAVHVACYNEPPEVVARTLDSLVAQDYPRDLLHIVLADDSTDASDVATLRAACEARGVVFLHREHRAGFKAGALNAALRETPPDVELVAVVDADFVADPGFVRDNVGFFADPRLAFLQTKLDYGNADESFTARYATLLEHFFYSSMMHTRNEGDAILFCGTMGILRRSAIEAVGGWTDGHVGEDVDMSCRLIMAGWASLYVPTPYGRGLQTTTHEAFRLQQARWAYGGARILSDHGRRIVTGRMTVAQKLHYLYGPIFWLDGSLALLFSVGMLVFAGAFLSGHAGWLPVHDLVFVGLIPILVILENALRSTFTMRRLIGVRLKEVGGMILLGWSGKLQNARSAAAALVRLPQTFHRTPKIEGASLSRSRAALQALRVAPAETFLGALQGTVAIAMTTKLALRGSGELPMFLVASAALMSAFWAAYFLAAPACVVLGHASRRRAAGKARGSGAAPQWSRRASRA